MQNQLSARRGQVTLSSDGYIRLRLHHLCKLEFTHLLTALDDDFPHGHSAEGAVQTTIKGYTEWVTRPESVLSKTTIEGYTEWVSHTEPVISLGWDWQLGGGGGQVFCTHSGDVRSNLMLVDDAGLDLGMDETSRLLETWLKSFDWQPSILAGLNMDYSSLKLTRQ